MEWRTDIPKEDGEYLVTTRTAMMVDSKSGPHSYAYTIEIATFYDGEWENGYPVFAWMNLPDPYFPD